METNRIEVTGTESDIQIFEDWLEENGVPVFNDE